MHSDQNNTAVKVQKKLHRVSTLVMDLLIPQFEVLRIGRELGYDFRDRIHNAMVVV